MSMIGSAVGGLRNLEKRHRWCGLQSSARHVCYGVRTEHYATVGSAPLRTLEQGLGPKFTPRRATPDRGLHAAVGRDAASALEEAVVAA